jgi:hypothetical protein
MKVAICTPHHGEVKAHYAFSLAQMMEHCARQAPRIEAKLFMLSSSLLPKARTLLAEQALAWGADWLLWIDADHLFPPDSLPRLLASGRDVVGANYPRRMSPGGPTAAVFTASGETRPVRTTAKKARSRIVEEVGALGLGLCLMRASLFERIARPWFQVIANESGEFLGEDGWFFQHLKAAGVPIHVDHGLSWEVGHVGEVVLTNQQGG